MQPTSTISLSSASVGPANNRYQSIEAVLSDANLDLVQKRAILASWASDLWAIESCPWLREVPGVQTPLKVSEIFAALRALDDSDPPPHSASVLAFPAVQRTEARGAWRLAKLRHAR